MVLHGVLTGVLSTARSFLFERAYCLVILVLTPLSSKNTRLLASFSGICFFHACLLLCTSGTLLFRSVERLLFENVSEFEGGFTNGFIAYLQLEFFPYLMDRDIRLCLYQLVNILKVALVQGRFTARRETLVSTEPVSRILFSGRQTVLVFTEKHSETSLVLSVLFQASISSFRASLCSIVITT